MGKKQNTGKPAPPSPDQYFSSNGQKPPPPSPEEYLAEKKSPDQTTSEDSGIGSESVQDPFPELQATYQASDEPVRTEGEKEVYAQQEKKEAESERQKQIAETPMEVIDESIVRSEEAIDKSIQVADSTYERYQAVKAQYDVLKESYDPESETRIVPGPEEVERLNLLAEELNATVEAHTKAIETYEAAKTTRDAAIADRYTKRSQKGSLAGAMEKGFINSAVDMGVEALRIGAYYNSLVNNYGIDQEEYMAAAEEKLDKTSRLAKSTLQTLAPVATGIDTEETTEEFIAENTKEFGLKSGLITIAQSAPMMAGGYYTMFLGMAAEADKMIKEAPGAENLSVNEKMAYQAIYGSIGAVMEMAGLQAVLGFGAGGKAATAFTNRVIKEIVGRGEQVTLNRVQRGALQLARSGTAEGLTEVSQESLAIGMEETVNLLKDAEVFQPNEWVDVLERNGQAFKMGLNAGLIMGAPTAVVTSGRRSAVERSPKMLQGVTKTDYENAEGVMDPAGRTDVIGYIENQRKEGNISQERADEMVAEVDEFIEINGQMKAGMTTEQKMEAFGLLMKKRDLKEQIARTDEALLTNEQEQLDEVNAELGKIVGVKPEETTETEVAPAETEETIETEETAEVDDAAATEAEATEPIEQVEVAETQEAEVKPVVKKVKSGNTEFTVDMDTEGNVSSVKTQTGKTIEPFTKTGKTNSQYSKAVALATGQMTDNQIKLEREAKLNEVLGDEALSMYDAESAAMTYLAQGAAVNPKSVQSETGQKSENLKWVTSSKRFQKEETLPTVKELAEGIWEDRPEGAQYTDQDVRNALIRIFNTYTNREEIKDAIIDRYEQHTDPYYGLTPEEILDMEINSAPEEFRNLYETVQAESSLSPEEKIEYYEKGYRSQFENLSPEEQAAVIGSFGQEIEADSAQEGTTQGVQQAEGTETFESAVTKGLGSAESFLDDLSAQLDAFGQETLGTNLPVIVAKAAVDAARTAVKAGKNASQAIDAAIQAVRDSEWYKGLTDSEKKGAEKATDDLFRKPIPKSEPKKDSKPKPKKPQPKKVESNTGEPLEQPKGTENTQSEPTKETEKLGNPEAYQKTVNESYDQAEEQLSGIKNDLVPEGKQGTFNKEKRTIQETLDRGKALVDSGTINPRQLVEELNSSPRALQPDETAALVYYKAMLDGQNDALYDTIEKAKLDGNGELQSQAEMALAEVEAQIDAYHEMQELTGYEQGLSLRMRGMLITREYALKNQERKFKRQTGRDNIPPEIMARFKLYEQNLKELEKRIKEVENQRDEIEGKLEILKEEKAPKSKKKASGLTDAEKKRRIQLRKKFMGRLNDITAMAQLLADKEFYEYAGLVFKEAKGEFNEFARKMMNEVGKGIKEHLPKLYKDLGGEGSTKFNVRQPEIKDGQLYIPDEFVIDLIKSGFDTIETASKEALRIIKEVDGMKDVTERQVRDAISDYGKRSKLSKDEINVRLREMKRMGKLLSALEDVKRKKRPKRSGKERDDLTDKERKLRRQINELLKEIPQTDAEIESAWKSALDGVKQRMRNRIADLKEQIKTGERTQKKKAIQLDVEAQSLREEIERLNAILQSIEGKTGLSFEKKVQIAENALEKSIKEYERRIKQKDFTPIQQKPVSTPKLEKLREQQNKLREQYKQLRDESPEGQRKRDETALKRITRQINKVSDQIAGKVAIESKKQARQEYGAHVEAAKKRLESLREQLRETEQFKEVAEKKKLEHIKKTAQRSIDRYKQRIENKDYAVKKPAEVKLDEEAKRLKVDQQRWKNKFDLEREKQAQEDRTRWEKFSDFMLDILTAPKTLLATADLSAPLRQGAILSARRPKMAIRAGKEMFGQAFSEQKYEQWMDDLVFTEEYVLAKKAGLYLSMPNAKLLAKEEQFISNIAERIPGYGRVVRGSNRAYSAYLNYVRMDSFVAFAKNLENFGLTQEQKNKELKAFAKFVNNASGRGNLGNWEPTDKALSILFFAPKYVVSRLNIIGNSLTGFAAYPKHARKEALKTVGSYYSIFVLIAAIMAAAGADVEDDPRSSDFGKIRFGKLRFDLGAGLLQPIRVLAQIFSQQKKSIQTGEIIELNQGGWGQQTTADVGKTFLRGKLSPTPGAVVDFMSAPKEETKEYKMFGQTFEGKIYFQNLIGEKNTIPEKAVEMVMPLFASDMKEVYQEEGAPTAAAAVLPALFGVGVQYYGEDEETDTGKVKRATPVKKATRANKVKRSGE